MNCACLHLSSSFVSVSVSSFFLQVGEAYRSEGKTSANRGTAVPRYALSHLQDFLPHQRQSLLISGGLFGQVSRSKPAARAGPGAAGPSRGAATTATPPFVA